MHPKFQQAYAGRVRYQQANANSKKEERRANLVLIGLGSVMAGMMGVHAVNFGLDSLTTARRFKPEVMEVCPYQKGKMEQLADMRWSHYSRGYGDGNRKLSDFENESALAEVGLPPHAKWGCGDLERYLEGYLGKNVVKMWGPPPQMATYQMRT